MRSYERKIRGVRKMVQRSKNTQREDFPVISAVALFFMALLAMIIGHNLLGNDFPVVIRWWLGVFAAGIAFFPLAHVIGHKLGDGGYIIGKAFGVAAASWVIWVLSSLRILKFNEVNSWIAIAICAVLNYGFYSLYCARSRKAPFTDLTMAKKSRMLYMEVLFMMMFILLCYVRSFKPDIDNQTEKYMDFGFLSSIMSTDYMPPRDMWYA